MLKILINPDYGYMRPFVENIGAAFSGGVLLQKGHRNTLRTFTVHGTEFVVKQFGKPNPFNRIVYSLIRKPKGLRAYEYAFRIQAAGFDTPTPVSYVEERHMGLIGHSYFISTRCPYADPEHCFDVMRKARAKFWKRFSKRHKVKYRLEL